MRPVVAREVGGETILKNLIDTGAAVAYERGGHQYVKLSEHCWDNITGFTATQGMGGVTSGANQQQLDEMA